MMNVPLVQGCQQHFDSLGEARESLLAILKYAQPSVIEEAFILETVNRLRDIQNSARFGEE